MTPTTISGMLADAVRSHPERVFVRSRRGDSTYADVAEAAIVASGRLRSAGVEPNEAVGLVMRSGADQIAVWFALSACGQLHVPINTALVGDQLVHVVRTADISSLVVDTTCVANVAEVIDKLPGLRRVIVVGSVGQLPDAIGCVPVLPWDDLDAVTPLPVTCHSELDVATLLFTSGSTGRSKACALSHRYMAMQGYLHCKYLGIRCDDVLYTPFPLFHIDGANLTVVAALAAGCTAALGERFSVSGFWPEVREFEATVFNFMGATLTMLFRQPPSADDRNHRVRFAWGVPMPDWYRAWQPRFGFPLREVYGSTDAGVPAYDYGDEAHHEGSCGRIIPEFEVIAVDDDEQPCRPEQLGELWVRGREPGLVMNGYHGMPDATADAMHSDGWVRTGDCGRIARDGKLYFHSRRSDSIRRRGENISAHEVEMLFEAHRDVAQCAAIGVPSDLTEEDVKVFVQPRVGCTPSAAELIAFAKATMPSYMVPRYLAVVDDLPRTPTEKVDKAALRGLPVCQGSVDLQPQRVAASTTPPMEEG